jgi:hypothetical protein
MFSSLLLAASFTCGCSAPPSDSYFKIRVVDKSTGRGVPLVELKTVNDIRYVTDSNGVIAFLEPGLMDQEVYFAISSHGYEYPKDGFGYRGKKLKVVPGGSATLQIERLNIAERLYRVTGAGIYADSVLVGEPVPAEKPVLNGQVFGSDSVVNAVYRGKIYWFWGDTNRPSYPLGNFAVPGAISELPGKGGLDPDRGINLTYFLDDTGFAKPTAKMPGPGPTWISGLTVLDDNGKERLFAQYVRVTAAMKVTQRGLLEFDDELKGFKKLVEIDLKAPLYPLGNPFPHNADGQDYIYFGDPYPVVRVKANVKDFLNVRVYQSYTCFTGDDLSLDRDEMGKLRFAWRTNVPRLTPDLQNKLRKEGKLKADEGLYQLRDVETGKAIHAHAGSVYWNDYRKRWVMITTQLFGSSLLGEVWYAEAEAPTGPWVHARKIVTHDRYDFYNPKHHPMLDREGGKYIYFEGTYTNTFSGNPDRTPRYNYNQIMYKLDLSDSRLTMPLEQGKSLEGK